MQRYPLAVTCGRYTIWPMICGMLGKFAVTAWESSLIKGGMDRLALRKLSTTICSVCVFICVPAFTIAPTPLLATLAYCGVSLGGCFEYLLRLSMSPSLCVSVSLSFCLSVSVCVSHRKAVCVLVHCDRLEDQCFVTLGG